MSATAETTLRELDGVPIQEVVLHPNEVVLWSHPAKRMSNRGPSGLLVVTNERLLFAPDSRLMRGVNDVVWETELDRIASIYRTNFKGNLLFGSLAAGLGLVFSAAAKTGYTKAVELMQCACVELDTGESEYFLNMKGFVTVPTAAVADELVAELSNAVGTARAGGVSPVPEAIPNRGTQS